MLPKAREFIENKRNNKIALRFHNFESPINSKQIAKPNKIEKDISLLRESRISLQTIIKISVQLIIIV